jgi:hypothetical protein
MPPSGLKPNSHLPDALASVLSPEGDTSLPVCVSHQTTENLFADLVDDQLILVSNVKVAIDDHRMWPTLAIVCRKLKLT